MAEAQPLLWLPWYRCGEARGFLRTLWLGLRCCWLDGLRPPVATPPAPSPVRHVSLLSAAEPWLEEGRAVVRVGDARRAAFSRAMPGSLGSRASARPLLSRDKCSPAERAEQRANCSSSRRPRSQGGHHAPHEAKQSTRDYHAKSEEQSRKCGARRLVCVVCTACSFERAFLWVRRPSRGP